MKDLNKLMDDFRHILEARGATNIEFIQKQNGNLDVKFIPGPKDIKK